MFRGYVCVNYLRFDALEWIAGIVRDNRVVEEKFAVDLERIVNMNHHPCAQHRALVVTEALCEYATERQLLDILQFE